MVAPDYDKKVPEFEKKVPESEKVPESDKKKTWRRPEGISTETLYK